MAVSKTTSKKKSTTKKSVSRVGSTGLTRKHFFKGWMVAIVVLLVAVVGYAAVRFSEASGYLAFSRKPSNIYGSKGTKRIAKRNGQQVILVDKGATVWANISKREYNASKKVCVVYVPTQKSVRTHISIDNNGYWNNSAATGNSSRVSGRTLCSKGTINHGVSTKDTYKVYVSVSNGGIAVTSMYGKK